MKRFINKIRRKKVLVITGLLSGFFGLAIFGLIGFIVWASIFVYGPVDSYEKIYTEPWASLNADMMLFEKEDDFIISHQKLDAVPLDSSDRIVAEFLMGKNDLFLNNLYEAQSHFEYVASLQSSANLVDKNSNVYFFDEANASLAKIYYLQGNNKMAVEVSNNIEYRTNGIHGCQFYSQYITCTTHT